MNEQTLQEVLKENKQRYLERKKEQRERIKKEERETLIIVIITSIFILGLTFKILIDMENDAIKQCTKKGYSQCEYRIN